MSFFKTVIYSFSLLAALICTACEYSPATVDRTMAYNNAVADSNNEILLLNIIRASQRYPTFYTRLEGNTSIGTFTPSIALTAPLSGAKQVTTTAAAAATATQITRGALSMMPQLQATETNQLALQTLDDQKYITGMLTPITPDRYAYFQHEGWPSELLGLMLFEEIDIPGDEIADVQKARDGVCAKPTAAEKKLCEPIDPHYKAESHIKTNDPTLSDCSVNGRAPIKLTDPNIIMFLNDAALPTVECFQTALRTLLLLGLDVAPMPPPPDDPRVTFFENDIPAALKNEPQFINTLVTNNLIEVDIPGKKTIALCKTDAKTSTGASSANSPTAGSSTNSSVVAGSSSGGTQSQSSTIEFKLNQWSPSQQPATKNALEESIAACQAQISLKTAPDKATESSKSTNLAGRYSVYIAGVKSRITLGMRSTEGMMYYLGQIARVETNNIFVPNSNPPTSPTPVALADGSLLFSVLNGLKENDALVSVEFGGKTYSIPSLCGHDNNHCNLQYPNHQSLDALTLVNQMWGLQKEEAALPPSPAVTVINP